MGHGDVGSGGDGAAPAGESFAVGEVEEFDEVHAAHAKAPGFEETGGGLGGLGLVEGRGYGFMVALMGLNGRFEGLC